MAYCQFPEYIFYYYVIIGVIFYSEDDFTGNSINENHNHKLEGKVGAGEGGNVIVKSRYGQIK